MTTLLGEAFARIDGDTRPLDQRLQDVKTRMAKVAREGATLVIKGDDKQLQATALRTAATVKRINDMSAKVDISTGDAAAKLDSLELKAAGAEASFDRLKSKAADTGKSVRDAASDLDNTGSSALSLGGDLGKLSNFAMPALIGSLVALAPTIITVGTGLGGLGLAAYGTVKPIEDAAQKTGGLAANMSSLNTAQQGIAKGILGLGGQFHQFTQALQPEVVSAFNTGLHIASGLLGDIEPVAKAAGGALDSVLGSVDHELQSGTWQQFFSWMAQQVGPDIKQLGGLLTDILQDVPGLIRALQPLATSVIGIVDDFAKLIGVLTQTHTLLPLVGAAIGFALGGPVGAAIGGVAGLGLAVASTQNKVQKLQPVMAKAGNGFVQVTSAVARFGTSAGAVVHPAQQAAAAIKAAGDKAFTASLDIVQLDQDWNTLVGNFVGQDQVFLQARDQLAQLSKDIKQTGDNSRVTREQFDSYLQTIGSGYQTLVKTHASVGQINDYLSTQISALQSLGPLNKTETAELQGLKEWYDKWANSTNDLNAATQTAITQFDQGLIPDLTKMHVDTPQVRGDINDLAASILKTGNNSASTRGDRQQLITDLENAGLNAQKAKQLVNNLQAAIDAMQGKTVNVDAAFSGQGSATVSAEIAGKTWVSHLRAAAAGMYVTGGTPGKDSVLISAMPGEVVVPTHMVKGGAVDHLRGKIPGFSAGGLIGKVGQLPQWSAQQAASWGVQTESLFTSQVLANAQKQLKAQAASMSGFGVPGPGGGAPAANAALARRMMSAWASGAEWAAWNYVAMRESGWNQFARNPSSGAYGIPQALPPSKMGPAANPPQSNPAAQISWMIGYIRSVYGDPIGAAAHERAFNWYSKGTGGAAPGWAVVGERGPELIKMRGGETVLPSSQSMVAAAAAGYAKGTHTPLNTRIDRVLRFIARNAGAPIAYTNLES